MPVPMQSLPTTRGRAVRTSTGWVWSCAYCTGTRWLGLTGDPDPGLDIQAVLNRIDADHMHLRRPNP